MANFILKTHISGEIRSLASKKANELGKLRNSILKGNGNLTGFIGEYSVIKLFDDLGIACSHAGDYQYDIILGDATDLNKTSLEVKTKFSSVVPQSHYECSVANYNTSQKCDFYYFVRTSSTDAYILGYLKREKFWKIAEKRVAGQTDGASNMKNGAIVADCWNVTISALKQIPLDAVPPTFEIIKI